MNSVSAAHVSGQSRIPGKVGGLGMTGFKVLLLKVYFDKSNC